METQLKTTLTLNNGQFVAACDDSQARTGKFQNAVGGGSTHFVKFNTHMLESRRNMRLLGEAMGANLGPMSHMIHGFGAFGMVAGGAIAAIILLREEFVSNTKEMQDAADKSKDFHRSMRDIRMEAQGLEFTSVSKQLDAVARSTEQVRKDMAAMEAEWATAWHKGFGESAQEYLERTSDKYRDLMEEVKEGARTAKVVEEEGKARGTELGIKKKDERGAGSGASHIGKAMYGSELGAYKLEHTDPTVALLKESVEVQKVIAAAVVSRTSATPFKDLTKLDYASDF